MTEDQAAEAKSIFQAAADLPPGERRAFLSQRCGHDPELRDLVERLLVHHDGDIGDFLEPPNAPSPVAPEPSEPLPERVGPYVILCKLGEGGMGEVFEAEQETPIRRRVALKVIKRGMDTKEVLARFEAERQALALMDHPGIAKVLDAGETEHGRPYFVMDLIQGVPITEYCDRQRLATKERLDLFIQVCQAIQHAHTKGVIHRDVKPSNILVTKMDGAPVPKVIDFGIAKATAQSLTEKTLYTVQGQIVGTPVYMSPEQVEMTGLSVDTRTDVYSLGVLLYELLTGFLPFETKTLMEAGIEAMRRIIREEEPPKPSTRISSLGEGATTAAAQRRTEPARLRKIVRGELDWITMRALEKDPARRYQSPSGLAEDVERYQRDEAILAGPPSTAYQLKKLVGRHKIPVAFAATVLILLLGFAISMSMLRRTAEKARAEAQARAEELEIVTEFQASMLSGIDIEETGHALFADLRGRVEKSLEAEGVSPAEAETALVTFDRILLRANASDVALEMIDEQLLSRAVEAIEAEFADQPLVRAALQQTVANTYQELGRYSPAMPLQEAALATRRHLLGDDHPETLRSIDNMGALLWSMGQLDEALGCYREALDGARRVFGDDHPETQTSINNLGVLLYSMGRFDEALVYYREALEGKRRVLGDNHPSTLNSINNMGALFKAMGRFDEALVYHREALEGERRVLGDDHPNTLNSINNMGDLLKAMGRLDEALGYFHEALEGKRRVLGDDHPNTLISINNMGLLLQSMGRLDEALVYHREALEDRRRVLGDDHPSTLISINNMGLLLRSMGRLDEALGYFHEALIGFRQVLGDDHPNTLISIYNIGLVLRSMGQLDEAESYCREALEGCCRVLGDEHPLALSSICSMGTLLLDQGKPDEAMALLTPAEAAARRAFTGGNSWRLGIFLTALGRSRAATGAFDAAQSDLTEAHAILRDAPGASTEDRERALIGLVELYERWHAAEPGREYDTKAAEWRERLEDEGASVNSGTKETAR